MIDVSDRAFAKFLGAEMRRARDEHGWTREDLAEQLPSGIGDRTILSYEHGIRYLTVVRFVEICRAMGIAASDVLRLAEVAADDLTLHTLTVNVRAMQKDDRGGFGAVVAWARARAAESWTVRVEPATVREMAAMLDLTHEVLASYLAEFAVDQE